MNGFIHSKISHLKLDELIGDLVTNDHLSPATVNLIIDYKTLLRRVLNMDLNPTALEQEEVSTFVFDLISETVNFVAYYRHYFMKNLGKSLVVDLICTDIYGEFKDLLIEYNPEFKKEYYEVLNDAKISNIIKYSNSIITDIAALVPNFNFHLIPTDELFYIDRLVSSYGKSNLKFLMTVDPILYQVEGLSGIITIRSNSSTLVKKDEYLNELSGKSGYTDKMIPVHAILSGSKRHSFPGIKGIGDKRAFKFIDKTTWENQSIDEEVLKQRLPDVFDTPDIQNSAVKFYISMSLEGQRFIYSKISEMIDQWIYNYTKLPKTPLVDEIDKFNKEFLVTNPIFLEGLFC